MGFFKSLVSQKESAIYAVETRLSVYEKLKKDAPELEAHQWLLRTYMNYFESRRKAFPGKTEEDIQQYGFLETMIFAALPEPNNINALALYLLQKTAHIDGGLINVYPDYEHAYNLAMMGIADIYSNDRPEFMRLYTARNPHTADEYINHESLTL